MKTLSKKRTLLVVVILIIVLSLVILIATDLNVTQNKTGPKETTDSDNTEYVSQEEIEKYINIDTNKIDATNWRDYNSSLDKKEAQVTVKYPNWTEKIDRISGGTWDITLTEGEREIKIDLSGQGNSTFEQSLNDWITIWGSNEVIYESKVIFEDKDDSGRPYKIFLVTEQDDTTYTIGIIDVGEMYGGRAHLALLANNIEDIPLLMKVISTIDTVVSSYGQ